MVVFKREEDAESAVSQFHKRTLDGSPMQVEIVEAPPAPEPRGGGGVRGRGGAAWRGVYVCVCLKYCVYMFVFRQSLR